MTTGARIATHRPIGTETSERRSQPHRDVGVAAQDHGERRQCEGRDPDQPPHDSIQSCTRECGIRCSQRDAFAS